MAKSPLDVVVKTAETVDNDHVHIAWHTVDWIKLHLSNFDDCGMPWVEVHYTVDETTGKETHLLMVPCTEEAAKEKLMSLTEYQN